MYLKPVWPNGVLFICCSILALLFLVGNLGLREVPWRIVLFNFVGLVAVAPIMGATIQYRMFGRSLVILTVVLGLQIFLFAKVYYLTGLKEGNAVVHDFGTAMYFSVITWTTLGYGDVTPVGEARVYAAMQALIGLVFMGLYIGIITQFIQALAEDAKAKNVAGEGKISPKNGRHAQDVNGADPACS